MISVEKFNRASLPNRQSRCVTIEVKVHGVVGKHQTRGDDVQIKARRCCVVAGSLLTSTHGKHDNITAGIPDELLGKQENLMQSIKDARKDLGEVVGIDTTKE